VRRRPCVGRGSVRRRLRGCRGSVPWGVANGGQVRVMAVRGVGGGGRARWRHRRRWCAPGRPARWRRRHPRFRPHRWPRRRRWRDRRPLRRPRPRVLRRRPIPTRCDASSARRAV